MLQRRDPRPRLSAILPVLERDLDRDFDRGRAIVREEHPRQPPRQPLGERRRQGGRRLVGISREDHLLEYPRLPSDRLGDLGLRVAMQRNPPRRDRVDDLPTVDVDEHRTFGASNGDRRRRDGVLGIWMPEMLAIQLSYAHDRGSASANAASNRSMSASVCAALIVMRSRDVPNGTVGGLTAPTRIPRSRNAAPILIVASLSPITTGTICPSRGPGTCSAARTLVALRRRRMRNSGSD